MTITAEDILKATRPTKTTQDFTISVAVVCATHPGRGRITIKLSEARNGDKVAYKLTTNPTKEQTSINIDTLLAQCRKQEPIDIDEILVQCKESGVINVDEFLTQCKDYVTPRGYHLEDDSRTLHLYYAAYGDDEGTRELLGAARLRLTERLQAIIDERDDTWMIDGPSGLVVRRKRD